MDHTQEAKRILSDIVYVTLATVSQDGQPWNSPLFATHNERYSFFWTSSPDAQHSKNIASNGKAFMTVYDPTPKRGTGVGVYLLGRAEEMTNEHEIDAALGHFYSQKQQPIKPAVDFLRSSPRRLYRFTPSQSWINVYETINGFGVDVRKEVVLW